MKVSNRIVNVRYTVKKLHFDAAIDCDWVRHNYDDIPNRIRAFLTPVEIYCIDRPSWDVRMVYQDGRNDFSGETAHTECDFQHIVKETKKWIKEMED